MALAALIIGSAVADGEDDQPRAALPLLGRTLVEYQARQAAAAGAGHIVILVERVPAGITAAIDRLKRDGILAELARSVADAADRIHPDERLLLIADGVAASSALVARAARLPAPALLTLPDSHATLDHERIDAGARWAGLALTDGGLLRRTAALLGDWDLPSTLLRRMVQLGATRVDAGVSEVRLVTDRASARAAEALLIGGGALAARVSTEMLDRGVRPFWLRAGAIVLAGGALAAFANGLPLAGALALALSGPLDALPRRLDAAALRPGPRLWSQVRIALALLGVGALSASLWRAGESWGVWALCAGIAGLAALLIDRARRSEQSVPDPAWLGAILAVAAAINRPVAGLAMAEAALFVVLLAGQRRPRPAAHQQL